MKFKSFIITALTVLLIPVGALADPGTGTDTTDPNHFDWGDAYNKALNSATFYDPHDICSGTVNIPTSGGGIPGTPSNDNEVIAYNFFISKGLAPFRVAAIVGNLMQESHVNPKSDNPAARGGGGGIAQWEGGRWNGPDGLLAFAAGTGDFLGNGKQGNWDDLTVQLNFMWWEANNNRIEALKRLKNATQLTDTHQKDGTVTTWEENYEGAGIPMMTNRLKFAQDALADKRMGNGAPDNGPVDTAPTPGANAPGGSKLPGPAPGSPAVCQLPSSSGGSASGIAGTALSDLSWPKPDCIQEAYGAKRQSCHDDSTPAYAAKGGTHTNPGGNDAFTDCGTFVATVMHLSGADPKYPPVQTTTQRDYVEKHPELYVVTPHPKKLQPGDILISDGHTMIYVGDQGGQYPRVDGSWHDHTPQRGSAGGVIWMLGEPGIVSAHYIGKTTTP